MDHEFEKLCLTRGLITRSVRFEYLNSVFLRAALLLWVCLESLSVAVAASTPLGAFISTHSIQGHVGIKSWKVLRDENIIKQDLDYSCGAASLATLLNNQYGQNVTEEALLKAMDKGDGKASFEDMARALTQFGFRAQGFAANWDQLVRLNIPVILYVKHRRDDHFTVLRGISKDAVWLADPSLGNRTYSREQFLEMWQTRAEAGDGLAGRFLAVLPVQGRQTPSSLVFFDKQPQRQSHPVIQNLAHGFWR